MTRAEGQVTAGGGAERARDGRRSRASSGWRSSVPHAPHPHPSVLSGARGHLKTQNVGITPVVIPPCVAPQVRESLLAFRWDPLLRPHRPPLGGWAWEHPSLTPWAPLASLCLGGSMGRSQVTEGLLDKGWTTRELGPGPARRAV